MNRFINHFQFLVYIFCAFTWYSCSEDETCIKSSWYADEDGDGYGDIGNSIMSCDKPEGYVSNNEDCNDFDTSVYPDAPELCDGKDNNCDGQVDESDNCPLGFSCFTGECLKVQTWYKDVDGDNFGNTNALIESAVAPTGYVSKDSDCNDENSAIYPGAPEVCDGLDNNCDGQIDEQHQCPNGFDCVSGECVQVTIWYKDNDGDSFGNADIVVEATAAPNGYVSNGTDCNDENSAIYPGAPEVCDGLDNNCDGQIDEQHQCPNGFDCVSGNCLQVTIWYMDNDGDLFGNPNASIESVEKPAEYVLNNTDCDDSNPNINPGASELCNGIDDDCDGIFDNVNCPVGFICDGVYGCIPESTDLDDLPIDTGGDHIPQVLGTTSAAYGYYVYLPGGYNTNVNKYPLLVYLHGKSEQGDGSSDPTVLNKVIKLGPPKMIENGSWDPTYPMIVISPQYHGPSTNNWGAKDPQNLKGFIEFAINKYRINTSRIYLTGLSHGGNGVYDYLTKLNDSESLIAAAAPVASYGANSGYSNCANTPIWVFVGDGDRTNFNTSLNFITNYNSQLPTPNVKAKFTVFPGAGHNVWDRTYSGSGIGTADGSYDQFNQELYDWFFSHERKE